MKIETKLLKCNNPGCGAITELPTELTKTKCDWCDGGVLNEYTTHEAIDEIERLEKLIEKSYLIEVPATTVEKKGCTTVIDGTGKMLVPRDYLEREGEKTKLLSKLAQYARDNWTLRNELKKMEADK